MALTIDVSHSLFLNVLVHRDHFFLFLFKFLTEFWVTDIAGGLQSRGTP